MANLTDQPMKDGPILNAETIGEALRTDPKFVRPSELKPGDVYRKQGVMYKVVRVTPIEVYYTHLSNEHAGAYSYMGKNSKERIELVF